jgi:hypothetical protein
MKRSRASRPQRPVPYADAATPDCWWVDLTNGGCTCFDATFKDLVAAWSWRKVSGYASSIQRHGGKQCTVYLHRLVAGAERGGGSDVDNVNHGRSRARTGAGS